MLRRQQAEAVISARKKLVEGAVTMVEMALQQLSEKDVEGVRRSAEKCLVKNTMLMPPSISLTVQAHSAALS